jgi:hypothetical protein
MLTGLIKSYQLIWNRNWFKRFVVPLTIILACLPFIFYSLQKAHFDRLNSKGIVVDGIGHWNYYDYKPGQSSKVYYTFKTADGKKFSITQECDTCWILPRLKLVVFNPDNPTENEFWMGFHERDPANNWFMSLIALPLFILVAFPLLVMTCVLIIYLLFTMRGNGINT